MRNLRISVSLSSGKQNGDRSRFITHFDSSVSNISLPLNITPSLIQTTLSDVSLFLKCRGLIRLEKQSVGRKSYQSLPVSLSSSLQSILEPLMTRAERKIPQNQVIRTHPLMSFA